ncbi:hypothetical protein EDB86DRAFT_3088031 [Lactarius hatsudake]|nr:hypothetical protein EDB86DRAFT_3088031 [Lactarius hatsudake]
MSRVPPQDDNATEPRIGLGTSDYQYPPQSVQNQASHGVSNFVDGSGPIFSMYLEMASEEDRKMTEGWKADADGILIFTGLFSAAVASLISVSIQDIRPNPQGTSNFYLANIYHTVSNPNQSNIPLPSSPPSFSPPTYAVWVNSLWFLSLVISLTCALLATLLQQWARRYLKVTQSRYSPHKRARIRAFFAEGVDKFLLPWVVEALPALLHISLFLFFAGLIVFLCNVNITAFKLVLSWVGIYIDTRAFMWTFDSLDEDHELERFFSGLSGFRNSKVVDDPLRSLTDDQKQKLFQPLSGLLHRTLSSDLLPVPVKKRRVMICAKAIDPAHHPRSAFDAVDIILSNDQDSGSLAAEILPIQFGHLRDGYWPSDAFSKVLKVASDFNVQDTSPELQHTFCAMWNQIVLRAQNHNDSRMALYTLGPIRNVYAALHQDTDSAPTRFSASTGDEDDALYNPSSYPVCNIAGHIHDNVLHDNAALSPTPLASPYAHFPTVPAPPQLVESLTEVPSLDSFLPVRQTTTARRRILVASPDPTTAGDIRDVVTSALTVLHCTPDTSTSTPPLSSTSPTAAVALQHNPDLLTSSDLPNLPLSASSNPVLESILPTVTTRSISPRPTSAPGLSVTAAEDGGVPMPGLRKGKDVGHPTVNRAIRANTVTPLDLPPRSLSLPSEADSDIAAVAGPSQRAERTGDHSSHFSHCRYDIV